MSISVIFNNREFSFYRLFPRLIYVNLLYKKKVWNIMDHIISPKRCELATSNDKAGYRFFLYKVPEHVAIRVKNSKGNLFYSRETWNEWMKLSWLRKYCECYYSWDIWIAAISVFNGLNWIRRISNLTKYKIPSNLWN